MASNTSLICSGFRTSSSLEDSGWDEARASTANTLWTSFSTIRSFWKEAKKMKELSRAPYGRFLCGILFIISQSGHSTWLTLTTSLLVHWLRILIRKSLSFINDLQHSRQVQHRQLPDIQRRRRNLRSARDRSTTWWLRGSQTTEEDHKQHLIHVQKLFFPSNRTIMHFPLKINYYAVI